MSVSLDTGSIHHPLTGSTVRNMLPYTLELALVTELGGRLEHRCRYTRQEFEEKTSETVMSENSAGACEVQPALFSFFLYFKDIFSHEDDQWCGWGGGEIRKQGEERGRNKV